MIQQVFVAVEVVVDFDGAVDVSATFVVDEANQYESRHRTGRFRNFDPGPGAGRRREARSTARVALTSTAPSTTLSTRHDPTGSLDSGRLLSIRR